MRVVKSKAEERALDEHYPRVVGQCPKCREWAVLVWLRGWLAEARMPCTNCGDESKWVIVKHSSLVEGDRR